MRGSFWALLAFGAAGHYFHFSCQPMKTATAIVAGQDQFLLRPTHTIAAALIPMIANAVYTSSTILTLVLQGQPGYDARRRRLPLGRGCG